MSAPSDRPPIPPVASDAVRAAVYREVAELVQMLPLGYRPQDVAAVIAESADQLAPSAHKDAAS